VVFVGQDYYIQRKRRREGLATGEGGSQLNVKKCGFVVVFWNQVDIDTKKREKKGGLKKGTTRQGGKERKSATKNIENLKGKKKKRNMRQPTT